MSIRHGKLVQAAKAAIDSVHSDTSVSPQRTADSLRELKEHIDPLIDAVQQTADEENEDGD